MALNKQVMNINFAQGLDTKTDPKQVTSGKFLSLQNTVFNKGGLLQKRNGFQSLTALNDNATYLTTFNGGLTAIGSNIDSYSSSSKVWTTKGTIQPLSLSTVPLVRNSLNQIQCDTAVAYNGLICTVYTETNGSSTNYKYIIQDSIGSVIVNPTTITGAAGYSPRVFSFNAYFIIMFTTSSNHLQYIAISAVTPSLVTSPIDIANSYIPSTTLSFDAVVTQLTPGVYRMFIAYPDSSGIELTYLDSNQIGNSPAAPVLYSGLTATLMSLCVDPVNNVIYVTFWSSGGTGYTLAVGLGLNSILSPINTIASGTILNITSVAYNGLCTVYTEASNVYAFGPDAQTNYISGITITQGGTVNHPPMTLSVGLASKAVVLNGQHYVLAVYSSAYQPTYFLLNIDDLYTVNVIARLAYQNGGGYLTQGLPSLSVVGTVLSCSYLYKDLITSVNKGTALATGTQVNGIYSQTGINRASFDTLYSIVTAEIGNNLNINGGFLWAYDGQQPVEQNFFLYPDNIYAAVTSTSAGSIGAGTYYYQVCYEWTDNQGNTQRSAPSVPVGPIITSGSTNTITVYVPNLRLTYKSNVRIVVYRWSQAQQSYYAIQPYSATAVISSKTADSTSIIDTAADSTILGNALIYTTGGVVEDVSAPATNIMTLFDTRLWLVDSEDPNLLWFSKQVIEATPVEMSDLFTFYVAPTTAAQGSTGPITAMSVMDDKLIIFKRDAIYYINGVGPDNTGSNNQYSQPIFITSTVGCSSQNSIIMTPSGLMFQSDKGIWLLGRDLITNYIGAPVEAFNGAIALSAVNVPGTNQVRFALDIGIILMYDYYYNQWGSFVNVPAISSCVFQNLHTIINSNGGIFQELPDSYTDGNQPVLMSFTTNWFNFAGLQGYQRAYDFTLLGQYLSPHYLSIGISYDYNSNAVQQTTITPNNYTGNWGGDSTWGTSTPWGGPGNLEQWRIFLQKQLCQSFQITLNEIYNPVYGTTPGAGFTLSGLALQVGMKSGRRPINPSNTIG